MQAVFYANGCLLGSLWIVGESKDENGNVRYHLQDKFANMIKVYRSDFAIRNERFTIVRYQEPQFYKMVENGCY